uniref:Uncharacterized protein n=1 Tax=Arundo donax TaxID=35708 RepID=A0A0A9B5G2_ARUDO
MREDAKTVSSHV